MTPDDDASASLYGRRAQVDTIARARPPLLVLHGDSGVGKSALLQAAQATTNDALAPAPIAVFSSDGAVHNAVLDALSAALAALVLEEAWVAQRATIIDFIRRLVARGSSEARSVIGLAIVGRFRDRFGDEAVDAVGDLLVEARASIDAALDNRISAARSSRAAEQLIALADELRQLSGRSSLVIALDRLEVLPEGDVRILADVARAAPQGVCIRGALMDASPAGRQVADILRSCGGHDIQFEQIAPLDVDAVRAWLGDAGLDPATAEDLASLTGGYPLHLGDVILHLRRGGGLHDITLHRDFGEMIEPLWRELSSGTRQVARQLCVLERPLPLNVMIDVLGLSEAAWWDSAAQLRECRVFTQVVDGLPWFHEQRRRWLLSHLSEQEQSSYAKQLLARLLMLFAEPAGWRYASTIGGVTELTAGDIDQVSLRAIASLSDSRLGIMGALLELSEQRAPAVEATSALSHARHFFKASGDLVADLEALHEAGLLAVASNDYTAVVVPVFDVVTVAGVAGLCHTRLGRLPIPSLASTIWRAVLGPLAGKFGTAMYGIGAPPPGRIAHDLHVENLRRTRIIGSSFEGCVVYGEHRFTPVYAVASVDHGDAQVLATSWGEASSEVGGATFVARDVVTYPSERLLTNRWSKVAERLIGPARVGEDAGLSLWDELEMESRIRESARRRMTRLELVATGEIEPTHIYVVEDPSTRSVIRARGVDAGITRVDSLDHARLWNDPYALLRVTEELALPASAHIDQVTTGGRVDRSHPLRQYASRVSKRIAEFNRDQPRLHIDLTPGVLEQWLEESLEAQYSDANALFEVVAAAGTVRPVRREIFIVTSPIPPDSPIEALPACVATRPSDQTIVNYRILDSPLRTWGYEALTEVFPQAEGCPAAGHAVLDDAIAEMAGYADDDVSTFRSMHELGLTRERH